MHYQFKGCRAHTVGYAELSSTCANLLHYRIKPHLEEYEHLCFGCPLEEQLWVCRDGVGTMISTDFYEGIRPAQQMDLDSIEGLLRPLAQAGVTKARSRESLMRDLHSFTVLERESEVPPLNISHCTTALAVILFRLLDAWICNKCCQCVFVGCCIMEPKSMSSHACHKSWHAGGEHLNARHARKKGHGHLQSISQIIRVHWVP